MDDDVARIIDLQALQRRVSPIGAVGESDPARVASRGAARRLLARGRIADAARALERAGDQAAARQTWTRACLVALGAGEVRDAATLAHNAHRPDLEAECLAQQDRGWNGLGLKVPQGTVVFVCGLPASGKSTVAWLLSGALGAASPPGAVETSTIIAESWERAHGLHPGTVLIIRAEDPDAYRGVLGPWGERMARRNGWPAARIAVARGHRIIAGTRRLDELQAAIREADRRGLGSTVLWVERAGASASDNIDSDIRRLAEDHGAIVENGGDIAGLLADLGRIGMLAGNDHAGALSGHLCGAALAHGGRMEGRTSNVRPEAAR